MEDFGLCGLFIKTLTAWAESPFLLFKIFNIKVLLKNHVDFSYSYLIRVKCPFCTLSAEAEGE
jgi:hypothetical protein